MAIRYLYQRSGGPLVTWNRMRPPGQSKAAPGSLGSLGDTDVFNQARRLPRGGAPEYISDGFGATAIEYGEPVSNIPSGRSSLGPRGRVMMPVRMRRAMGDDGMFANLPIIGGVLQAAADVVTGDASAVVSTVDPSGNPVVPTLSDRVGAATGYVPSTWLKIGVVVGLGYLLVKGK